MPCETCGHGVEPVEIPEPEETGYFREKYRCSQGHYGFVEGKEEHPASSWNRYGPVFESY